MSPNPHLPIPVVASCGSYTFAAVSHPVTAMSMLLGIGIGAWLGSVLLAVAMFAAVFAGARVVATSRHFRRSVDAAGSRKYLVQRRDAWQARLEAESAMSSRESLTELIALLEEVERSAPSLAQRYEVEALVESWVQIAVAHERHLRLLRSIKRDELAGRLLVDRARQGAAAAVRCEIIERRIAAWDECRRRAERMSDELAAILELVRLLAQRASHSDAPEEIETVRHMLGQLQDEDDALQALVRAAS